MRQCLAYRAWAIGVVVPKAWAGCVQSGTILLHYRTIDYRMEETKKWIWKLSERSIGRARAMALTDVFVGFLQFRQDAQAIFNHWARPLVDFVVLVCIAADGILNGFLNDFADIVNNKLILKRDRRNRHRLSDQYIPLFELAVTCRLGRMRLQHARVQCETPPNGHTELRHTHMPMHHHSNQKQTCKLRLMTNDLLLTSSLMSSIFVFVFPKAPVIVRQLYDLQSLMPQKYGKFAVHSIRYKFRVFKCRFFVRNYSAQNSDDAASLTHRHSISKKKST